MSQPKPSSVITLNLDPSALRWLLAFPMLLAIAAASPTPGLHVELTDQTMFPFLADVIPVRLTHVVYSAGDLVLAVGGFLVPFRWVRHE